MSRKAYRVLSVIAGVLLIAAGIYCLVREDVALATGALLLGIMTLVSGVVELTVFAKSHDVMFGSGWLLLDGILTVILSLFLLFNQFFTMLYLPFIFSAWLMFSGVFRIVSAFDLKALGVRHWGVTLVFAIILTVCGFIGFIDPWVGLEAVYVSIGAVFILEGIDSIIAGFVSGRRDF